MTTHEPQAALSGTASASSCGPVAARIQTPFHGTLNDKAVSISWHPRIAHNTLSSPMKEFNLPEKKNFKF
jgi:hypothetical protein